MAESLEDTVASLLRESRAAHDRARTARSSGQEPHARKERQAHARMKRGPRAPKHAASVVNELSLARSLRIQAHNMDRKHTAPAWAEDVRPTHEEFLAFYHRQLDD